MREKLSNFNACLCGLLQFEVKATLNSQLNSQKEQILSAAPYSTCVHLFKFLLEFGWCEPVTIQPVVPIDPIQHLEIASNQPVSALHHHLPQEKQLGQTPMIFQPHLYNTVGKTVKLSLFEA